MTQSPTPSITGAEGLPIVAYDTKEGLRYPDGVPFRLLPPSPASLFTLPLTQQAPAQALIDSLRSENERLRWERDATFAMSRCECSTDEACANLATLHAELDALKAGKDRP